MITFDQLHQAALELPHSQRAELVDALIASLASAGELPVDAEWMQEIERRSAEIDAGTAELIPWEEVRRRMTAR